MDMMNKGKGKEFFINLNDENFDYAMRKLSLMKSPC